MRLVLGLQVEERDHAAHLAWLKFDDAPRCASDAVAASRIATTRRPAWPSVSGVRPLLDAVDELRELDAERLGHVELRRPHVAGPVADQHLVDRFVAAVWAVAVRAVMPLS